MPPVLWSSICALDRVVAEAGRRGLRLILPLADYWPAYGGIAQWLAWRGTPVDDADRAHPERYAARFYGDAELREAYAARVRQLATRRGHLVDAALPLPPELR